MSPIPDHRPENPTFICAFTRKARHLPGLSHRGRDNHRICHPENPTPISALTDAGKAALDGVAAAVGPGSDGGNDAPVMTCSKTVQSLTFPPVNTVSGRPRPSQARCGFVEGPPRDRPMA